MRSVRSSEFAIPEDVYEENKIDVEMSHKMRLEFKGHYRPIRIRRESAR